MENNEYLKAVQILDSLGPAGSGLSIDINSVFVEKDLHSETGFNEVLQILLETQPAPEQTAFKVQMPQVLTRIPNTQEFSEELESAERELDSAVKKAEKVIEGFTEEIEEAIVKRAPGSVLVSLSLQDQIAELERISLGLDENVFNRDRLRIIEKETKSLRTFSMARNTHENKSDLEVLRNKRLQEVMDKLKLMQHHA